MSEQVPNQEAPQENKIPDTVAVSDLDHFVTLLTAWHNKQVSTLIHLQKVPEGMETHIEGEEPLILSGDVHRAFKLGISLSLNYLGVLPFSPEFTDEPTQ